MLREGEGTQGMSRFEISRAGHQKKYIHDELIRGLSEFGVCAALALWTVDGFVAHCYTSTLSGVEARRSAGHSTAQHGGHGNVSVSRNRSCDTSWSLDLCPTLLITAHLIQYYYLCYCMISYWWSLDERLPAKSRPLLLSFPCPWCILVVVRGFSFYSVFLAAALAVFDFDFIRKTKTKKRQLLRKAKLILIKYFIGEAHDPIVYYRWITSPIHNHPRLYDAFLAFSLQSRNNDEHTEEIEDMARIEWTMMLLFIVISL